MKGGQVAERTVERLAERGPIGVVGDLPLWIGNDDLLYGVDAVSKRGQTTSLRFSHYNDVTPITAPS